MTEYLPYSYRYQEELTTGKLDKQFLNIFLKEIFNDYLIYHGTSLNPNMASFHLNLEDDDDIHKNFTSKPWYNELSFTNKNIVIPNQFDLERVKSNFKKYTNYNFIHHGCSSYPFVISIIQNWIYDSNYQHLNNLDIVIQNLNDFIAEQVYLIETDPEAREKYYKNNQI